MPRDAGAGAAPPAPAERLAGLAFHAALAAHALAALVRLARFDGDQLAKSWFEDDAFHALVVANHVVAGDGATFDGLSATNGVQPLWLACCCLIALVAPRSGQVAVLFAAQALLLGAAAWWLRAALVRIQPWAANLAVGLLLASPIPTVVVGNGMAGALGLALLAALFRFTMALPDGRILLADGRQQAVATALLAGLLLTGVELGLVAVVWLLVGARNAWRDGRTGPPLRRIGGVAFDLAAIAAIQVALSLWAVDWPVPIADTIAWDRQPDAGACFLLLGYHVAALVAPLRFVDTQSSAALGAIVVAFVFVRHCRRAPRWRQPLAVSAVAVVALAALTIVRGARDVTCLWPTLGLGAIACCVALAALRERLLAGRPAIAAALAVVAGAWAVVVPVVAALQPRPAELAGFGMPEALWDASLRFLRERVPADELVAGTAIGHLAFASGRPIVQLDGVVGDRAYLEALRGRVAADELRRRGVRWVIGPLQHRDELVATLGAYYHDLDVQSVTYVVDAAGMEPLGGHDFVFVRLLPP